MVSEGNWPHLPNSQVNAFPNSTILNRTFLSSFLTFYSVLGIYNLLLC